MSQEVRAIAPNNMASAIEPAGWFAGERNEDLQAWLRRIETIGVALSWSELTITRAAVLGLRKEALDWAAEQGTSLIEQGWENFKAAISTRFNNEQKTDKLISSFFAAAPATTYDDYIQMLKHATILVQRNSISTVSLIRKVTTITPSEIKSLLLQFAGNSPTWESFRKAAEDNAWVAFPEKAIFQVRQGEFHAGEHGELSESEASTGYVQAAYRKTDNFCRLHGDCDHGTLNCEIIRLVEAKGWKRVAFEKKDKYWQEKKNKRRDFYSLFTCTSKALPTKLIHVKAAYNNHPCTVLIDTGAEVSLINNKLLGGQESILYTSEKVIAANSSEIRVIGRIQKLSIILEEGEIEIDGLITDSNLTVDVIIGSDMMCKKPTWFCQLLCKLMQTTQSKEIKACEKVEPSSDMRVLEIKKKYANIFDSSLFAKVPCTLNKFEITTREGRPVAQKNWTVPLHYEEKVAAKIKEE
jgi:hypothetical protein